VLNRLVSESQLTLIFRTQRDGAFLKAPAKKADSGMRAAFPDVDAMPAKAPPTAPTLIVQKVGLQQPNLPASLIR
jgi:hypothetical protein